MNQVKETLVKKWQNLDMSDEKLKILSESAKNITDACKEIQVMVVEHQQDLPLDLKDAKTVDETLTQTLNRHWFSSPLEKLKTAIQALFKVGRRSLDVFSCLKVISKRSFVPVLEKAGMITLTVLFQIILMALIGQGLSELSIIFEDYVQPLIK